MGIGAHAEWNLQDSKLVTPDEVRTILSRAVELGELDPYWLDFRDFYAVAVHTGLRLSEVAHVECADLLPTRILVTRRKKKHLHPTPIEIMPEMLDLLRKRADRVGEGYLFPGNCKPCEIHRRSGQVELACVGGHMSLRNLQRRWRLLIEDCGLYQHGRGIHSLRHTAITELYKLTRDLRKAQVFAGHSTSQITERYAHVVDLGESLAKLPRMM